MATDQAAIFRELMNRRNQLDPGKAAIVDELAKRMNLISPSESAAQAPGIIETGTNVARDIGKGIGKGLASTVYNVGSAIGKAVGMKGLDLPEVKAALEPKGDVEKVAFYAEQIGEFFVPGVFVTKVGKGIQLGKWGTKAAKAGLEAVSAGAVTAAQTGGDTGDITRNALMAGAAPFVIPPIGKAVTATGRKIMSGLIRPLKKEAEEGFKIFNLSKYNIGGSLQSMYETTHNAIAEEATKLRTVIKNPRLEALFPGKKPLQLKAGHIELGPTVPPPGTKQAILSRPGEYTTLSAIPSGKEGLRTGAGAFALAYEKGQVELLPVVIKRSNILSGLGEEIVESATKGQGFKNVPTGPRFEPDKPIRETLAWQRNPYAMPWEIKVTKALSEEVANEPLLQTQLEHAKNAQLWETILENNKEVIRKAREVAQSGWPAINVGRLLRETARELDARALKTLGINTNIRSAFNKVRDDLSLALPEGVANLSQAQDIKRSMGKLGSWTYGVRDPESTAMEQVANRFYTKLRIAIEQATPQRGAIGEINKKLSELIPIEHALIKRIPVADRQNLINLTDLTAIIPGMINPKNVWLWILNRLTKSGTVGTGLTKAGLGMQRSPEVMGRLITGAIPKTEGTKP